MDSALAWIGQIAEWVGQFFPRFTTLDLTQGAVRTTGYFLSLRTRRWLKTHLRLPLWVEDETRVVACGPGLHWWWPARSKWEVYPTSFQTDNLPAQTIETSDGVSVTVGGMISYKVADIVKLLTQCHSPIMAIRTITLPAVHQVVCKMDWASLKNEQQRGTINTKLRNATQKKLAEFGIAVDSVELTDMTKVKALRLIQSTQTDQES